MKVPVSSLSSATLFVDAQQFPLSDFGSPPRPIPTYKFIGTSGNQAPMSQIAIGLSLAPGYAVAIEGQLTLSVDNGGLTSDPAVQFASGGRVLQTATVAGPICPLTKWLASMRPDCTGRLVVGTSRVSN